MDEQNKLNEMLQTLGAMAETTSIFYTTLISHGVPEGAAVRITIALVQSLIRPNN